MPPFIYEWLLKTTLTLYLIIFSNLGNIAVAWRLPEKISENVRRLQAYKLIMKYLTNTQVNKTKLTFVIFPFFLLFMDIVLKYAFQLFIGSVLK